MGNTNSFAEGKRLAMCCMLKRKIFIMNCNPVSMR